MSNYNVNATLSARDQGFSRTMRSAVSAMGGVESSAGRLSSRLKQGLGFGVLMGIGTKAVNTVTGAIRGMTSQVGNAVNRFDTLNNFPKIMKNLGYSTKDANKALDTMSKGIDGLPTSLDSIASASQKIAPLTGNLDKAAKVTVAMNNALLAGGKSAEVQSNALEQFSQMLSAGKVDMQSWRSMLDAMPGQLGQMAKALVGPKAKANDLYEAMKSGKVSFDDFNNALLELNEKGLKSGGKEFASFAKQAKSATGGIGTQIANLKTGVVKGITSIIAQADKTLHIGAGIKKLSTGIKGALDKIGKSKTFKIVLQGIKSFIKGTIPVVRAFAKAFGAVIGAFAKAANKSGGLKSVLSGLQKALIGVAKWIEKNADTVVTLTKVVIALWAAYKGFKILSAVTGKVRTLIGGFQQLTGAATNLISGSTGASSALSKVGSAAVGSLGIIGGLAAGAAAAVGIIGHAFYKEYTTIHASTIEIKKNQKARQEAISANAAEAAHITDTWEKLQALNKVEHKSATQKAKMKGYIAQLNGAIDGLNIKYDEETGKIKGNIKAINRKINAYMREARAAVYKEQIKKATEDLIKQEEKESKLQEKIQKLRAKGAQDTGNPEVDQAKNLERLNQIKNLEKQLKDVQTAKGRLEKEIGVFSVKVDFDPRTFDNLVTKAKKSGFKVSQNYQNSIKAGKATMPNTVYQLVKAADPQFKAAVNKAKNAGVKIPPSIRQGINSGKTTPSQAIAEINNLIAAEAKKAKDKVKGKGDKVPSQIGKDIDSNKDKVKNATQNAIDNGKNATVSGFGSLGTSIVEGIAAGVSGGGGILGGAVAGIIQFALSAGRAEADVNSPSRLFRDKLGTSIPEGLAVGMIKGMTYVKKAAKKVIKGALSTMKVATGKKSFKAWGQNFTKLASQTINKLTSVVNKAVRKATSNANIAISTLIKKAIKNLGKGSSKLKSKLRNISGLLKNKYAKYIQQEGRRIISAATKTLNKLANTYQKAYEKIVEARNTFVGNLKDYGSLFTSDSYGFISFENWDQDIADIRKLTKNLKLLKKWGISEALLNEITAMSTADQLKFTNEMIARGKSFFQLYNKGFKNFIKEANRAGTAIYSSYVKALDVKYNKELKKVLKRLRKELSNIGTQAGRGLIAGLSDKATRRRLNAVARGLANSIIKQIKKTLKIKSPSRVMMSLAEMAGQGFVKGLDEMQRAVQQSAGNLLQIPELAYQGVGLDAVTGSQNATLTNGLTIEVPLYINGKEFARATASDMQAAISKKEWRTSRNKGVR